MKKIILLGLGLWLACVSVEAKTKPTTAAKRPVAELNAKDEAKIEWLDIEEAVKRAKKKRKKILIDIYTDWCGWCKVMDKKTFSHPAIAEYINENFYAVKMNAEKRDNIIFNDQVYTFNEQGRSHNLAITLLSGQMSYPSVVYLDEKLKVIQAVPGFHEAKEYDAILHFFAENKYKKEKWEEFKVEFKSEIK
ncbi:Protein of unknown function, DUF255 [Flexibacter flexilis DSM 6793]|uniref:Spermatogenesis-associated protein 20-like TRX domain-containing protein n=1 Tax=Flexibacter flexilis DSM 6793 TaxID=927664 RepID=A0A1I1JXZ7_9BACT|nr:DUF255 domain-containing protein [Flexibacter flexilis]SFC51378.1 Protein of unknown function, DUF255 [Flexibacter flexilis DSM 6793]